MALPKIGLQAVLEGFPGFQKSLDAANKKMAESAKQAKEAAKANSPLSSALDKAGFSFDTIKSKISQFTGINAQAIDSVVQIASAFGPMALAAGAAAIAVVALGAGFLALGNRGAALVPLAESFDNLTASVGISSQALLIDLRKAANGTVSDFDLIKRANLALVGSTGEFGKAFGKALPAVLASARAAARATGQDVDFLFQSLVAGIKRASPRLIDNTGIVLKLSEAEATLAEQLGKSVEQLTLEEKQIAVLNATVAAGANLIDSLGDANESNAEKLARSSAIITNTFDSLAIAVQPAFGVVLDIVNSVLANFQMLAVGLAPILGAIASVVVDVFGGIFNTIMEVVQPIINAIASFLPYISILFQGVANVVHGVVEFIGNIVRGIVGFIQDVAKNLFGLDISNLGKSLFEGAAAAFGSFANGILAVANNLIFPAIIGIATFIADFLIGFSPPKVGPLSEIDKGGENLMLAWLGGITGVSLDSVADVAAEVSLLLGDIGKASLPQVDKRLKELDQALLPFQNRLDIVKSQFEAIAAPAQAALDAIDRQMLQAQEALARGDVGAADTIRRLDAAREAIQGQLDVQQALVDSQQIQFGLASASQAQERALLNIRKVQLAVVAKVAAKTGGAAGAPKEPKAPVGSGAPEAPEVVAGGGGFVSPDGSVLDLIGGQGAVNDAIAGIQDAFAGQIDTEQLGIFGENQALLSEQFDKIGSVDIGAKLGDKFKGLTDLFDSNVENSPANVVSRFFGDASVPGSFASFVTALPEKLSTIANDVGESIGTSLRGIFVFFTGEEEGSLKFILATLTGGAEVEGSVANFFSLLPERVAEAASSLFTELDKQVFAPVRNFLTGTGPGTLEDLLNQAVLFFEALPQQILYALGGFAESIYGALVTPVITAVNGLIGLVESAIKGFIGGIADFIGGIVTGLGDFAPQFLRDAAANLRQTADSVAFGRISTDIPDFSKALAGAATGGMFTDGLLRVGERGPEMIASASKIGVLPAELTRALQGLSGILAQPQPMMIPGGDTNYNNSSSTYNFNGVQGDNDARRRYNSLRAGMR
jgi:hypothetical protein